MNEFTLKEHELTVEKVYRNLAPSVLYEHAILYKMKQHGTRIWLVNTGWSGGAYGRGKRIKLVHTRAIVDAIHSNILATAETERDPVFGLDVVTQCPNVPTNYSFRAMSGPTRALTRPRQGSLLLCSAKTLQSMRQA
jgi:hypothetical protein